jgi:hypothetical protein
MSGNRRDFYLCLILHLGHSSRNVRLNRFLVNGTRDTVLIS